LTVHVISNRRAWHHAHLPSFPTRRSSDLKDNHDQEDPLEGRAPHIEQGGKWFITRCTRSPRCQPQHDSGQCQPALHPFEQHVQIDRKSTRLNSSHVKISYAVFCLKKKTQR